MWKFSGLAAFTILLLAASTTQGEIDDLIDAGVLPPAADRSSWSPPAAPDEHAGMILPDLQTLPPHDLQLQEFPGSGLRRLRFANTISNHGPGSLDLHARQSGLPGAVRVFQNIPLAGEGSVSIEAGIFDFHPAHDHWHWLGFGLYEVLAIGADGRLVGVVAASDKVGYCLIDVDPLLGAAVVQAPFYTSCAWTRQGISAGWTDTYEAHIGGQYVDISDLPDGLYALRSTVDPDNIIVETDDGNNSALVYFALQGGRLVEIGEDFMQSGDGGPPE